MEILDIWDEHGHQTRQSTSRDECHKNGLWHQTVHIWVVNPQNQLLVQQRQFDRESNPGKWDISAAGHIPSGQKALDAALRELDEEVGIQTHPTGLEYLGRVKHTYSQGSAWTNREYQEIYLHKGSYELDELNYQESEVNALKWISLEDFWAWSKSESEDLVSHPREYALMESILT